MFRKAPTPSEKFEVLMTQFVTPSKALKALMTLFYNRDGDCTLEDLKSVAKLLVKEGAALDVGDFYWEKNTLFHHLVLTNKDGVNNDEIAELLETNKELINIRNGRGKTLLQILILHGPNTMISEVEKLLQLGSNLHSKDDEGRTLLHTACNSGNLIVAQYLVSKGLDILAKTNTNMTMFHCSAYQQDVSLRIRNVIFNQDVAIAMWKWLLDNKVSIDAQDKNGQTALHLAACVNNIDMVKWLFTSLKNLN